MVHMDENKRMDSRKNAISSDDNNKDRVNAPIYIEPKELMGLNLLRRNSTTNVENLDIMITTIEPR